MAIKTIDDKNLTDIADAIRAKNGTTTTYKPSEMAAAITALTGGGDGGSVEMMTANWTAASSTVGAGFEISVFDYVDSVDDILMLFIRTSSDNVSYNSNFLYVKDYCFKEETDDSPYSASRKGVALGALVNPKISAFTTATELEYNSPAIVVDSQTGTFYPFMYVSTSSGTWNTSSIKLTTSGSYKQIWMLYKSQEVEYVLLHKK